MTSVSPRYGALPRIVRPEAFADVPPDRLLALLEAVTMILTIPGRAAERVDALVVPTGQGEDWRLTDAIRAWEAGPALRHLLVAGTNPAERTHRPLTLDRLRDLGLRRVDGVVLQAEPATDTGRQAAWIVDRVRALGIGSVALVVSPYHLVRVYLTVLRAADAAGLRLPMVPLPVAVAPHEPVPETGAAGYDLVAGEVGRLLRYADEGWVASPQRLRDHLRWLWTAHRPLLVGE
ncbi:ElyC/SanA/YdcF family protein [Micromonospora sp. WMMD975]|uniref:ElyC/SanA/YdcF family protein n=1 Tax=Micromonospora sp. WMMD975 TaxID=3016087 RepID=UPI00249BF854|nr:ElyC/SanA/YdcF family protein [Micromonospora sp. WMMD975]WFE31555.1 ElyC/SanA/YdcF family protein [Micromonospora sp. WMMD975]